MIWTLFALLLMVVLGGFISYYGDLQGRRWGKKRVSWFGMRPKHTAILITSLTGAFISLFSIITLLAISPVMRDVILRGEIAIRENKRLSEQYSEATGRYKFQITKLKASADKTQQESATAQQERATALAQLEAVRRELRPKQEAVAQLEHKQKTLLASLAKTKRDLELSMQQSFVIAKQNLALERDNRFKEQQNQSLARNYVALSTKNEELQAQNQTLTAKNADLTGRNDRLLASNDYLLKDTSKQLQDNAEKLRVQAEELKAKRQELALVTAQLEKARQEVNYAVNELEGSKRYFTLTYDQVRRGRVSVRAGGELARIVIDAHMSSSVVRTQLVKLLDEAGKAAQALGAATGENHRAVLIVPKRVVTEASEFAFSEEENIAYFTGLLTGADKPTVVIVSAFTNAIEGEQVLVNLQTNAAVPMFAPGKVLASCRLNANLSDEQLKQAIAQFLQTSVRDAAVKAGAISQVNPVSGVNELGQFDPIDLGQIVLRARQMHGDLTLQAVARAAITSADPLDRNHLRLEVIRATGNPKDS